MSRVLENFNTVEASVAAALRDCGRNRDELLLLVVSKTIPVSVIQELYDSGIREFGENREPELSMKAAALPSDIRWHFIGPLQANKVRKVVTLASVIHSVSGIPLIERIDRIAGEEGKTPEFLLEVNVSGEASKGGLSPAELPEAAQKAAQCRFARFRGLMTMAPLAASHEELLTIFGTLRQLRDDCEKATELALPLLSMGMSGDYPEAIRCGATIVRIGSRIFEGVEHIVKEKK